jgi:hypothetical protein
MTTRSGYGVSPYGGGPYGGAHEKTAPSFDIFCFDFGSMYNILLDPNVTTGGDGGHFHPNLSTLDMDVYAGAGEPEDDARIIVTANVPSAFTVEWTVKFTALPTDFTNLVSTHVYAGASDAAGALVGFLFSKAGVAYTGSVSFPGGDLSLDCTMQVLPGSSAYISEGEYYVVRAAADYDLGIVYFYMTKLADLPITGHKLRAVLPVIPFTSAANPPTDGSLISVRGTLLNGVVACWSSWCLGSSLIIPNLIPVSDAGVDQAVRNCSIIMLDGSASFDPEGADLAYVWRLIEGPSTSEFVVELNDGITHPFALPTGYTDKFHSVDLADVDYADPIAVGVDGDVLLARGEAYTIVGKGTDGNGFYVQVGSEIIPEGYAAEPFKVLRQRGIKDYDTVHPTFFPDKPGFYKFDLMVNDGALWSSESTVLVNVLESVLPRGCTPDLSFIFEYLSDFWGLVEDKERISTFWSSLAQVAATEMFTLWQLEYSKSLRDIQRYFNRRWLHYDLLLPEPIPELTKTRVMYGGVQSDWITASGESLSGLSLVIESPLLAAPVTLTIVSPNPVTPTQLATDLQELLQTYVGSGFTTHVVEDRVTLKEAVRVDAQHPFSVGAGTTLPFTEGAENRHPSGLSGAGVGYKGYKVDRSLEGLGIVEDDFLVVDGVAYRIASIQDIASDAYPYQRLVLKEQLPESVSSIWAISSWVSSELLDFYNGLVSANDYVDFEVSDIVEGSPVASVRDLLECRALGANESLPSRVAVDMWDVGEYVAQPTLYTTYLARVLRRTYVPVDDLVVDIPTLQRLIVMEDDTETLRRNVDYYIEDARGHRAVRFEAGVGLDPDVWEGDRPPNRLWAEYTYLDNKPLIEANFGYVIGLGLDQLAELPGNVDYLSAVRGLWHSFYNGPTLENLRIGAQILLGLPFAEEDGYIEEIRTDFSPKYGRILMRDKASPQIVRSYSFPNVLLMEMSPLTGARYVVGDFVEQFSPLVEGVEVLDYVKDPLWFQGYLNQGVFYEAEKYYRFAIRVDTAAFSVNTLTLVRNFILQAKPIYTYPLFVVRFEVGETEVSTTDQRSTAVWLNVQDAARADLIGSSFILDEPRCAFGGVRNRLDCDQDPSSVPPTSPVTWGLDRNYFLIPDEEHLIITTETFAIAFTPTLDSVFVLDQEVGTSIRYEDLAPASIPAGPTGFALTAITDDTLPFDGDVASVRFVALGDPGTDPTDYELVVSIGGVDTITQAFTAITNVEVVVSTPTGSGLSGDTIGVRVRPASGGARTPNWTRVLAYVRVVDAMWTLDDTLASGTYCSEHTS